MEKIPCNLIKDILPLYIDDAVSQETMQMVKTHLETCDTCRKEYEALRQPLALPCNPDLREEEGQLLKALKQKLLWKRIAIAVISVMLTLTVVISGAMIYREVGPVHDFFDPSRFAMNHVDVPGQWQTVSIPTDLSGAHYGDTLNFDSIFYDRKVVNTGNSRDSVTLRVLDSQGNVVVEEFELRPGESASLRQLQRFTDYQVEMKTDAEIIFLNFY